MKILKLAAYFGLIPAILLTSCATFINGTKQTVQISSYPSNALISIDGIPYGETPLLTKLKRKDEHVLRLELEGYQPYQMILKQRISGWAFGNIVFGGFIGIGVDLLTGGIYRLTPEDVHVHMLQNNRSCQAKDGKSYIGIVLEANHNAEKIGQLEKL